MGLPEEEEKDEVQGALMELGEVSEEVTGVQQRGRELGWVFVFQVSVKGDVHSVRNEDRRLVGTVSSG